MSQVHPTERPEDISDAIEEALRTSDHAVREMLKHPPKGFRQALHRAEIWAINQEARIEQIKASQK